jgi:hypothetical protein
MFISLSQALTKYGGLRIGAGLRITSKNAIWMLFVWLFVLCFKMMWYMMIVSFWCIYAICYGIVACIKALLPKPKGNQNKKEGGN